VEDALTHSDLKMIEASFLRTAYVAVAVFSCASTIQAQADSGLQNVKAMTFFKGDCQLQIIKGYFPCKDAVMWGEYTSGRASVTFFKDNMSFSVSGAGDRQPNLENYFQSIDRVRIMDGQKIRAETSMEGECHFHMNEQATVFYFIHCNVYNRQNGITFNFHLDSISSFDRKTFDSSGQPENTPTPQSDSVTELHLCRNASSPADKIAHCSNVISGRTPERALVTAHNTRGLALMEIGRYRDAIDDFNFVIAREPKVAGYYDNRQNAYRQSGMLEQALEDANRAIDFAPQYSFVFRGRANVYNDMEKYDLAIQDYDQAVKLAPEDGGLFIERGKIFRSQSKLDQAISDFSHALELDNKRWTAGYRERGFAYKLLGQTQNAVADLTTYNSLTPGDQEVVSALATLETQPEPGPASQPGTPSDSRSASVSGTQPTTSIISMVQDGGTFRVPVTINGQLTLKFVVDSGASDVSIPADVVMTLVRTETIADGDFLGKQTYTLADGSTVPSQRFVIRSLKVGDRLLENVTGSIAPVAGSLLLGQSFLSRFKSWSIDNQRQALILQ
jgi:tetratricopeptide (TPR) repeat protein